MLEISEVKIREICQEITYNWGNKTINKTVSSLVNMLQCFNWRVYDA